MKERESPAYLSSVLLHGGAIAIIVVLAYVSSRSGPAPQQIMELVAGPGDSLTATAATKLGDPGGIAVNLPAIPVPAPTPRAPAEAAPEAPAEPTPVAPAPIKVEAVAKPAPKPVKHVVKLPANPMLKALVSSEIKTESRIKMHDLKVEKEKARQAALAKKRAITSYEQFEKSQGAASPKGMAGGVIHGTSMDKGSGGKALTSEQRSEIEVWNAMLRQKWLQEFVPPADFDNKMTATVSFHVSANGSISGIRVSGSTGGAAFASAVADALRHVSMPPFPGGGGDDYEVPFSLSDQG